MRPVDGLCDRCGAYLRDGVCTDYCDALDCTCGRDDRTNRHEFGPGCDAWDDLFRDDAPADYPPELCGAEPMTEFACSCEPEKNGGCEARRGSTPELCGAEPMTDVVPCPAQTGPVWKLGGEPCGCALTSGHDGDHECSCGSWWVDSIRRDYPPGSAS